MKTNNQTSNPTTEKTTVFNLIILDESGSMAPLVKQTISGCNETLNVIRSTSAANPDTIRSLVSIYEFQSNPSRPSHYLIKNAKPEDVKDLTEKDYQPCGATPLLDAVGSTLSELKAVAATHENASGIVTIITDGYENSSQFYNWRQVANLIAELKEMGWTINLIGANIDVERMGETMNIDNRMAFTSDEEGTSVMYGKFSSHLEDSLNDYAHEDRFMPMEARICERKARSSKFFSRKK